MIVMESSEFPVRLMRKVVNCKLDLIEVLNTFIEGSHYSPHGNVFCPFHENTDTPAAKIYLREGEQVLFCFAEHKSYRVSDVFEKGLASVSMSKVFQDVWGLLSQSERDQFLEDNGSYSMIKLVGMEKLDGFMRNSMSFDDVLRILSREITVDTEVMKVV